MHHRTAARTLIRSVLSLSASLTAAAILLLTPLVVRADGASAAPPPPLEVFDGRPGVPARPIPGAPPAAPVRFEQSTAHQVNVAEGGANIPGDAANEPSIAVDPLAPNHMAIVWRQFDTVSSNFRQAGRAYSSDGGRTWTFPGVLTPGVQRSDPVLSYDRNGTFYFSSLAAGFRADVFKSTDRGVTWLPPVSAFGGDKQWITVDRTLGSGSGHVYESWSVTGSCCGNNIFTRSIDGAQSFQTPVAILGTPMWGTLDVAPDGTLYVSGSNFGLPLYVARSLNARDPQATPTFHTVIVDLGGGLVLGAANGPNPVGILGQIWVAVDPSSGPRSGWVYLLASVDPAGADPLDVHFARSTNGGVTWSPWVRVNDDPPSANGWQWFGTMSVAPTGRIDVVWNDTRSSQSPHVSALYYASSTDGGVSWSANQRLSMIWDSFVGWPQQNKIGDYYHMVSDAVGAHLAWAATFNGEQDVYYTRIGDYDCNVNGVADSLDIADGSSPDQNLNGIPDECEETTAVADGGAPGAGSALRLDPISPNPLHPAATLRFVAASRVAGARLTVYDVAGRLVRTLFDGDLDAGTHAVSWDGRDGTGRRLSSGVYYCRLAGEASSSTRAVVLIE